MKFDRVHEKFIYHSKNFMCCYQIRVHRFMGLRRVRCVEVLPEHMKSRPQSRNLDKKPSVVENFSTKFS
jgi:hypothetical protein